MVDVKQHLHAHCHVYVEERINTATRAIHAAQAAANEESKSSAGDKYETGRAMAQLEIEKHSTQLAEAQKLKKTLERIGTAQSSGSIQAGSLVITNQGNFYIAIAATPIDIEGKSYFSISSFSPIAQRVLGLRTGDQFIFNGKDFMIGEVW